MSRLLPAVCVLLLACGLVGAAASALPAAGTYPLVEAAEMNNVRFNKTSYTQFENLSPNKPESLKLQIRALDEVYYYVLNLGDPPVPHYLVLGRTDQKWFNALYLDANGDKTITPEERTEMGYTYGISTYRGKDYDVWVAETVQPLRIQVAYKLSNGATFQKTLLFKVEVLSVFNQSPEDGEEPMVQIRITPRTWFIGEVGVGVGRLMKVAVVDGNRNGLYNEAQEDYFLMDENGDSVFDWDKERQLLKQDFSGTGADGKKVKLYPALAAYPSLLCLALKGTTPDPASLEK